MATQSKSLFDRARNAALIIAGAATLSGCVSVGLGGAEPPTSLLTLTPTISAPVGSTAVAATQGNAQPIAVLTPEVPAKLDVLRVPVNVSDTQIAYVQQAFWVEKPARLFRRLLGETLRAKASEAGDNLLVIDSDGTPLKADRFVRGNLIEMTYDAPTSSVIVRFDAIRSDGEGAAVTRRFEARESGVLPDAASIGSAINRAANTVAGEVADWVRG